MPHIVLTIMWWVFIGFASLIAIFGTFFTVQQQSRAIIQRFGRYVRTTGPGLNFKVPFIDQVAARISLRVQQLNVKVETKTLDNVFVKLFVAVQFRVVEGSEADSFYKLQDHVAQITSYVLDVVRAQVPKMNLDQVFERKDDVGAAVKNELDVSMKQYGYEIPNALVTDVDPAEGVKNAMNEIQTQQRLQIAASAKGEANKILAIKNAEAEKETKRLSGEGVAAEREAIALGIKNSTATLVDAGEGKVNAVEAMNTLLMTQYFDTMQKIGSNGHATTIFLPHSPGGLADLRQQIAEGVMMGNQAPKPEPVKTA